MRGGNTTTFVVTTSLLPSFVNRFKAPPSCRKRPLTMATVSSDASPPASPHVQYVLVRTDLPATWTMGSIIAQAIHASTRIIWQTRERSDTKAYCHDHAIHEMRTIILQAPDEHTIHRISSRLHAADLQHAVWNEQPENIITALAAAPYARHVIAPHFKGLRLYK